MGTLVGYLTIFNYAIFSSIERKELLHEILEGEEISMLLDCKDERA